MPRSTRKSIPVHQILAFQLDFSTKSLREIATTIGYEQPNVLSMMKTGVMKIPLEVAPKLAKEVGLDPWHFTERCLAEYSPGLLSIINQTFGLTLSDNERTIVNIIRAETGNQDPAIKTKAQADALTAFARSLV